MSIYDWARDTDFNSSKKHPSGVHFHADEQGIAQRCYHKCKQRWYLWFPILFIAQVLMFPTEHHAAEWAWDQPGLADLERLIGWTERSE